MSSWDILGGDGGDSNSDEEVEYVGVIEEDAPPVREPLRPERRSVRRVMPMDQEMYSVPKSHKNGTVGAPNRDEEDLVSYIDMPHGKQLGLTPEAINRLQQTPMGQVNGQASQRLEPGTYVMYGPSRAEGMGALGTNGNQSLWGDIAGAIGGFGAQLTETIGAGARQRRELDLERYQADLARDAASEANQYALQEAMLQQQVRLEEIRAGADELAVLQEQAAAASALRSQLPTTGAVAPSGTSPAIWILVALLGVGAVGGVFYVATKKK